jgi:hypothetical protein
MESPLCGHNQSEMVRPRVSFKLPRGPVVAEPSQGDCTLPSLLFETELVGLWIRELRRSSNGCRLPQPRTYSVQRIFGTLQASGYAPITVIAPLTAGCWNPAASPMLQRQIRAVHRYDGFHFHRNLGGYGAPYFHRDRLDRDSFNRLLFASGFAAFFDARFIAGQSPPIW